jgi:hypothetical protein
VFVSKNEFIELLQCSLRAAEMEARGRELESRASVMRADLAARGRTAAAATLLRDRAAGTGVTFSELETRGLLADPPETEDGALDEAAFTTYLDGHIWDRRLDQITSTS